MEVDDGYFYLKMNMPVPKSPGKTSNDQTTTGPGVVHTHPKIDLPFSCAEINDQPSMRNGSTSTDLHGPDEGGGVAGDGHGAGDPPSEHKHGIPVSASLLLLIKSGFSGSPRHE